MFAPFEREGGENPYTVQQDLQETMQNLVGIIRTESEMKEAVDKIQALKERAKRTGTEGNRQYNPGWHLTMDLHSLLTVSEAITLAALERKESRGAHTRDDCPGPSDEFGKVIVAIRSGADGSPAVAQEPLGEMPDELKQLLEDPS